MIRRRTGLAAAAAFMTLRSARAAGPALRIGILNDQSSTYRDNGGLGSVACARQAIVEHADRLGLSVDLLSADHQNKPDTAMAIARQWFDSGVDVIGDFQNSAIALAVSTLVRERDKVMLACNVGVSDLTGHSCTPNVTHWAWDSQMLGRTLGTAVTKAGAKTWFFIRADYSFGRALQDDATAAITRAGGQVLGGIAMPFPSADFSAALLQAQASHAQVLCLANGGNDLVNSIKQAGEFHIMQSGQKIVPLNLFINNVRALGLETAQGLTLCNSFYWDMNDHTRALAKRVVTAGFPADARPNMSQAANYSAVAHYLKAAAVIGVARAKASGAAVVTQMKAMPVEDDVLGHGTVRADGRVVSPVFLFEVKQPGESKGPWDYYRLLATIPAAEAWRPVAEGGCPISAT